MTLPVLAAALFLAAALPIGFYVAFSDLSRMKIPNVANYALVAAYAVFGLIALPFADYLWQWTHLIVVLLIGILLNAAGVLGAGDAKFMAAAAPMIPLADAPRLIPIAIVCLLAGFAAHRIAKHTPIRDTVPHWESWQSGKRFPMGFPLAMMLVTFLIFALIDGQ
jgi:prepilin peptidase CpaA